MTKKLVVLSLVAMLISCSGNKNQGNVDSTPTDSINTDTILVVAETPEKVAEYLSNDLKKFSLFGPVKSVETIRDQYLLMTCLNDQLKFNESGKLTSKFDVTNEIGVNADGFINRTFMHESDGTAWELTYSEWDENGFPTVGKYTDEGPWSECNYTLAIVYGAKDSNGNWTDREIKISGHEGVYNENDEKTGTQKVNKTIKETRKIEYWK